MTKPATEWRDQHGIAVLYMGEIEIGRAMPTGGKNNRPRWLFTLSRPVSIWITAPTFAGAKACVEATFDLWLVKAGIT